MLNEKRGRVSVWIGSVSDLGLINDYAIDYIGDLETLDRPINGFAKDLGCSFFDTDLLAVGVSKKGTLPVGKLFDRVAQVQLFRDEAIAAAANRGITQGNVILALFRWEFDGTWPKKAPVEFIGNFTYKNY